MEADDVRYYIADTLRSLFEPDVFCDEFMFLLKLVYFPDLGNPFKKQP